jgi:glycosyltransferase involved in cell wall biosynthesis
MFKDRAATVGKLVAVVDGGSGGHEQLYVTKFARSLTQLGCDVHLCCPEAETLASTIADETSHAVNASEFCDGQRNASPQGLQQFRRSRIERWRELAGLVKSMENQHGRALDGIVLLSLSNYLSPLIGRQWVSRLIQRPIVGMHISPTWQVGPPPPLRNARFGPLRDDWLLGADLFKAVGVLCEAALPQLQQSFPECRFVLFPDVADTSTAGADTELADEIAARAAGRFVVMLAGSLDQRKNVELFLQSAQAADRSRYFFVLAGSWTSNSRALGLDIETAEKANSIGDGLLYRPQRFATEADLNRSLLASSCLWVNYRNFYLSSNFVTKGALLRRPLLSQDYGTIGSRVRRFRLGVCVSSTHVSSVLAGLETLATSMDMQAFGKSPEAEQFEDVFGEERFKLAACELRKELGNL